MAQANMTLTWSFCYHKTWPGNPVTSSVKYMYQLVTLHVQDTLNVIQGLTVSLLLCFAENRLFDSLVPGQACLHSKLG